MGPPFIRHQINEARLIDFSNFAWTFFAREL